MNYYKNGFNELTNRRSFYLLEMLKIHPKIIYSDIDTVWLKDPRPYFKGSVDFWAQIDGVIDGKPYFKGFIPYICTGFLAIKNTKASIQLLKNWHSVTSSNPAFYQDQEVIQKIAFDMQGVIPKSKSIYKFINMISIKKIELVFESFLCRLK